MIGAGCDEGHFLDFILRCNGEPCSPRRDLNREGYDDPDPEFAALFFTHGWASLSSLKR